MKPLRQYCRRGHELVPENIIWQGKYRACRACRKSSDNALTKKKNEEKASRARPQTCEVCGNKNSDGYAMAFDHNHGTDTFRGWLCRGCNSALGAAGDNVKILKALARYLEVYGNAPTRECLHSDIIK